MVFESGSLLDGFPVVVSLPVQWGDQDAFGHVNNTVYFRWFESARIVYGQRIGLAELFKAERIGPILASVSCDFRRQVTFPDTVHATARITRIGRSSMTMDHALVSEAARAVVAQSTAVLVVYDYKTERPHRVPDFIRAEIERLEQRSFA